MAEAGSSVGVAKAIADPLATLGSLLKALTPEGPVQTALSLVLGLCVAAAPFVFRYYIGVLGQGRSRKGRKSVRTMKRCGRASPAAIWRPAFMPTG
jgi:hypothetical protein